MAGASKKQEKGNKVQKDIEKAKGAGKQPGKKKAGIAGKDTEGQEQQGSIKNSK